MPGPLATSGDYQISLDKKKAEPFLLSLASTHEAAFTEATTFLAEYASKTPLRMMPPRLKELKGEWKGYYQLAFAGNHRLIYTVDEEDKMVFVEEIGPHPDWGKRRGGRGR